MDSRVESGIPKKIRTADANTRLAFLLEKIEKAEAIPSFAYLEGWENIPPRFIEEVCQAIPDAKTKMISAMVERTKAMPKWRLLNDIENTLACAQEEVRKAALGRFAEIAADTIWYLEQFPEPKRIAEKLGMELGVYKILAKKTPAKEEIDWAMREKIDIIKGQKNKLGAYLGPAVALPDDLKNGSVRERMGGRFKGDGQGFRQAKAEKLVA